MPSQTKRVLIIEDNKDIRDMINMVVSAYYLCEVATAVNGEGAIGKIFADGFMPDLILCDMNLGPRSTNGLELMEFIRGRGDGEKYRKIPFGFLTAESDTELKQAAEAMGAEFYIAKPFDIDELEQVLDKHLPRS
jgi:CheY-like chemotaxis protein